ncbi:MAG: recombinase family protein [Acidimicrobiales bacterium]
MRAIVYTRVSTAEQAADGLPLEAQEARCRAWAEAADASVVEVVEDAGVSGTKPLASRPGGARIAALLEARRPAADVVIVVRLDRLGRDAAESLALLKAFASGKVGLVSLAEHLDLSTPHGRAMAGVGAVFAELERALIAARTSEDLGELRRQGRAWNHPPFGYRAVDGLLEPDPGEQATLARARDLRDGGMSCHRIAATLTAEGYPTKRGGPWQATSVRSVLRTSEKLAAGDGRSTVNALNNWERRPDGTGRHDLRADQVVAHDAVPDARTQRPAARPRREDTGADTRSISATVEASASASASSRSVKAAQILTNR